MHPNDTPPGQYFPAFLSGSHFLVGAPATDESRRSHLAGLNELVRSVEQLALADLSVILLAAMVTHRRGALPLVNKCQ